MSRAYELEALKRYGINVSELGCVMLDVTMPGIGSIIPKHIPAYHSPNPDLWWVNGVQKSGHITLLYGLLPELVDKESVDEVLAGWEKPAKLWANSIDIFYQKYRDEEFACIVARVSAQALLDANQRLSLLPHINTHPTYKSHVTLMYTENSHAKAVKDELDWSFPMKFESLQLDYGHIIS